MNIKDLGREYFSSLPSTIESSTQLEDDLDHFCSDTLFPDCDYIYFVDKLSDGKHPVYLVFCSKTNQMCALKLFYWEDDQPSPLFTRELQFAQFTHSSIIKVIEYKEEQNMFGDELDSLKVSYIMMEYAGNGDLFEALVAHKINFDEVLIRTYFHHLIEAIDTLHLQGAAHLDIKPENLLISNDYTLKLSDFDLSYLPNDGEVFSRGTKNYRAPEVAQNTCENAQAADVYSAAITLFVMKTRGRVVFTEAESMRTAREVVSEAFWKKQAQKLGENDKFFSEEFKQLFAMMTKVDPKQRATVADIKQSKWYNMEVLNQKETQNRLNGKFSADKLLH